MWFSMSREKRINKQMRFFKMKGKVNIICQKFLMLLNGISTMYRF